MLPVLYCRVYCAHYTDIHHPLITLHWPRCQICQFQYKCISLILLMIRGQDKMMNYFSKYLGRGGWSSWEALPSSTQSAAANSGMMRELEPGTALCSKKIFHVTVIYIICCLYTHVNFLFFSVSAVPAQGSGAQSSRGLRRAGCVVTTTDH